MGFLEKTVYFSNGIKERKRTKIYRIVLKGSKMKSCIRKGFYLKVVILVKCQLTHLILKKEAFNVA